MGTLSIVFSPFGDSEELTKSINVLEAVTSNTRRSEVLIADFSSGFAKGWTWSVKREFSSALDITLSSRVVKGKPNTEVWTSGRMFSFAKGDIIYDAPEAYSNTWSESLKHINQSLEVLSATSADVSFEGSVEAQLYEKKNGVLVKTNVFRGTQKQFVQGLILGFDISHCH
jgi:hypothetical protein